MNNSQNKTESSRKRNIKIIITASIFLILLLWFGSWLLIDNLYADRGDRGTFGDMFGAVNALFSGLAFAGLIIAIYLQTQELSLQRQELEDTRKELQGQKEQLALQNKTLRQQRFENTFFEMLRLHNEIVNSIDLSRESTTSIRGRVCFQSLERALRQYIDDWVIKYPEENARDPYEAVDEFYGEFYSRQEVHLGHYFRNLYHIVKFVDQSSVTNQKLYTGLIRAQLSIPEQALLFFNCLSMYGRDKFKPLIEKYDLLQNLPPGTIPHYKFFNRYECSSSEN